MIGERASMLRYTYTVLLNFVMYSPTSRSLTQPTIQRASVCSACCHQAVISPTILQEQQVKSLHLTRSWDLIPLHREIVISVYSFSKAK